jgi:hypothetical protein
MHRLLVLMLVALATLVPTAWAQRQQRGPSVGRITARPNPIVSGTPTVLSGDLDGRTSARARVQLQADTDAPFGDRYQDVAQTTASRGGRFSFRVRPLANVQYRVVASTGPPVTSPPRLVLVRPLTGLRVSDRTPRAGSRVRFSGSVFPPKDGRPTVVQRRSTSGRWVTVARTTQQDAGDARSSYDVRVRVRRDATYRVKVVGDEQHINGVSREIAVDVI